MGIGPHGETAGPAQGHRRTPTPWTARTDSRSAAETASTPMTPSSCASRSGERGGPRPVDSRPVGQACDFRRFTICHTPSGVDTRADAWRPRRNGWRLGRAEHQGRGAEVGSSAPGPATPAVCDPSMVAAGPADYGATARNASGCHGPHGRGGIACIDGQPLGLGEPKDLVLGVPLDHADVDPMVSGRCISRPAWREREGRYMRLPGTRSAA